MLLPHRIILKHPSAGGATELKPGVKQSGTPGIPKTSDEPLEGVAEWELGTVFIPSLLPGV